MENRQKNNRLEIENAWGVVNGIPNGKNSHYDSGIYAMAKNGKRYINVASQEVVGFVPNNGGGDAERPCNLGNELRCAGYQENINLFVFNYPNEDAVKNSALKFKAYIDNLIYYVRQVGSNEMKACFYASKEDYENNCYKINIVGHSMGGLVARYFIENLYQDDHVDKLITIDTPHWGSGYANVSSATGNVFGIKLHVLSDHDLCFYSAMNGGIYGEKVLCNKGTCPEGFINVTEALKYQRPRSTRYYAIAGVDYPLGCLKNNAIAFEMPTDFSNESQIADWFEENDVYGIHATSLSRIKISPREVGDNMVGLLSQIGWIGDKPDGATPEPRIQMEKIFIDVDTDGGNGGGAFIWEAVLHSDDLFHCKVNHRQEVCDKVIEYLED